MNLKVQNVMRKKVIWMDDRGLFFMEGKSFLTVEMDGHMWWEIENIKINFE